MTPLRKTLGEHDNMTIMNLCLISGDQEQSDTDRRATACGDSMNSYAHSGMNTTAGLV